MRIIKQMIGLLLIVVGVGLFSYPIVTTTKLKIETKQYIKAFKNQNEKEDTTVEKEEDPRYQRLVSYNTSIVENEQEGFRDAWSYEQAPISLEGFEDGKFGYIDIPTMDLTLPLYIGASTSNLRNGAAILGQTSIPIGGTDTNSVIAGHRGYQGAPYFREIEKLSVGDTVYVTNPWEKLTYRVESIAVIDPYDNDAVKIQKGKDMITLVTCHPYRSHGKYRYVVYCVRTNEKNGNKITKTKTEVKTVENTEFQSSEYDIKRERFVRIVGGTIILVLFLYGILKKEKNELLQKRRN